MIVCLVVLGFMFSCSIVGCGTPGKSLKMINNTSVTVTMRSCTGNTAQARQCSTAVKITPNGSADFPLSSPGSGRRLVVITGYGRQPRCMIVPTTNLPESATADVTDANSGNCFGPFGGPVASA
jgi:hypothetical protein